MPQKRSATPCQTHDSGDQQCDLVRCGKPRDAREPGAAKAEGTEQHRKSTAGRRAKCGGKATSCYQQRTRIAGR